MNEKFSYAPLYHYISLTSRVYLLHLIIITIWKAYKTLLKFVKQNNTHLDLKLITQSSFRVDRRVDIL